MGFGDFEDPRRGVNGGDGCSGGKARGRLGEDAAAAADVEVGEFVRGGWGCRQAPRYEGVAQGVHEVQKP